METRTAASGRQCRSGSNCGIKCLRYMRTTYTWTGVHLYRSTSILLFSETWLNKNNGNRAMWIDWFGCPIRLYCKGGSLGNNWVKECVSILPPQEIKPTSFILVDIHPRAKSTTVPDYNRITLNTLQQFSPTFILGYFSQYITCPIHLGKTLDWYYGCVHNAYRSVSLAPSSTDHHTILLLPPSSPDIRIAKKATKTNKKRIEEGIAAFQGSTD